MLSFDITDRNIRIIRGVESSGKIRINSAATLNLEEEVIINGHVKDIPRLATLINKVLKTNKMADREAIISISSNLISFKELHIPKAEKESEFSKKIKTEIQSAMGIDDQYSISYIIVDDSNVSDESEPGVTVLATACPYEIIDCYKKVFNMLQISLKSVMVGCNSITKVLLSDAKLKAKMPLLAVQIDNTFISLNLYEKGQLAFSRFASIDPADYDNSEDYVFEAVNENIFRMLQFQKSRNPKEPIGNVVFYGDTHEYVRLTNALEQMEIETSIINVPPQIHGYENLEFSVYANAIGAMFKRNKNTERINLLETDSKNNSKLKSDSSYGFLLGGVSIITAAVMVAGIVALSIYNGKIENEYEKLVEQINSQDTKDKQARVVELNELKTKAENYQTRINSAYDAYKTKPIIEQEIFNKIDECVSEASDELNLQAFIETFDYSEGEITFSVLADAGEDPTAKYPSLLIDKLTAVDEFFEVVVYPGYTLSSGSLPGSDEEIKIAGYEVGITVKAGEIDLGDGEETTEENDEKGGAE